MLLYRRPIPSGECTREVCRVPPSPRLMKRLLKRYEQLVEQERVPKDLTFKQFFAVWACLRRGEDKVGIDDGSLVSGAAKPVAKISRPRKLLKGTVRTLALLVEFPDCKHDPAYTVAHWRRLLFGDKPKDNSMRQYYRDISNFDATGGLRGVDIQGQVHGWIKLPYPMSYYADDSSGMEGVFPRNAMGMARDAVAAARKRGVDFKPYDALGEGMVTALFIVHAGVGAEDTESNGDIWSHKGVLPKPVKITPKLKVRTYLTVPEDSTVGVCAHEWGHLAARWDDYYDTGEEDDTRSNGLGHYCLMSSGSWANEGNTPVLPTAMLRRFHHWIDHRLVQSTTHGIQLRPAAERGDCLIVHNPRRMKPTQYILVEYRRRKAQDRHLPDQGIAVYVVDEKIKDNNDENLLAIELMQADGKRDLAALADLGNDGDRGDLFPYGRHRDLGARTQPPLNLSDRTTWSGVTLHVNGKPGAATMTVDVTISA